MASSSEVVYRARRLKAKRTYSHSLRYQRWLSLLASGLAELQWPDPTSRRTSNCPFLCRDSGVRPAVVYKGAKARATRICDESSSRFKTSCETLHAFKLRQGVVGHQLGLSTVHCLESLWLCAKTDLSMNLCEKLRIPDRVLTSSEFDDTYSCRRFKLT